MQQIESKNDNIGQTGTKLRKKQIVNYKYIFRKNPSKTKGEEKHITDSIELKSTSQGKIHNTGKYGRERKYAGGETWSGHAQRDFGRGSAGQT